MNNYLLDIASKFSDNIKEITEYGSGNINDTYIVSRGFCERSNFILQKINLKVFTNPELIIHNILKLNTHIKENYFETTDFLLPEIIATSSSENYYIHSDNSFWRALTFVKDSISYEMVKDFNHALQIGLILGKFHLYTSTLDTSTLHDTLPGFHITPNYLTNYELVLQNFKKTFTHEMEYCHKFILKNKEFSRVLEDAKDRQVLRVKTIHGDPKISNILMDEETQKGISIIDLDTVKPGLIHYDIGDALRSCCNIAGEETESLDDVKFNLDIFEEFLKGYIGSAKKFLTEFDYDFIFSSVKLISFELGLRFFTDHLQGNIYFKTKHQDHNLRRALVQFKLCEDIDSKKGKISTIVKKLSSSCLESY